jgi:hypothetical protein
MKKSGDTDILLEYIVALRLDKPILLSNVLQKSSVTAEGSVNKKATIDGNGR